MTEQETEEMDRIQFTCMECGKEVDREPHQMDVAGLTPSRCAQCVFDRMAEP